MVTHQAGNSTPGTSSDGPHAPAAAGRSVFDAIADPTRRAILDRLSGGPMPAGAIAEGFEMSRPAVSKHLRVLESAGLVRVTKSGRLRLYEMDASPLRQVDRWLETHRTRLAARLVAIKRAAEAGSAAHESQRTEGGLS